MRHIMWLSWSILIVFISPPLSCRAADLEVAVVSMERVFDQYHKTREANALLKARIDEVDIKRQKLLSDVKTLKAELETLNIEISDNSLSESEQKKKKQLVKDKFALYRDAEDKLIEFDRTSKNEFGSQMRNTQGEIVDDIRETIQQFIKGKGIILVFDSSGKTMNGVESLIYFDRALDITDEVIALLNKDAPGAAGEKGSSAKSPSTRETEK